MATEVEFEDPDPVPSITVRVQVKARLTIEHINMHVHACWPLKSNVSSFEISSVGKINSLINAWICLIRIVEYSYQKLHLSYIYHK